MAYGGRSPTPTDALSVVKEIRDGDREKAVDGLKPLANALNVSVEAAAAKIFDHTCRLILEQSQRDQPATLFGSDHQIHQPATISPRDSIPEAIGDRAQKRDDLALLTGDQAIRQRRAERILQIPPATILHRPQRSMIGKLRAQERGEFVEINGGKWG